MIRFLPALYLYLRVSALPEDAGIACTVGEHNSPGIRGPDLQADGVLLSRGASPRRYMGL